MSGAVSTTGSDFQPEHDEDGSATTLYSERSGGDPSELSDRDSTVFSERNRSRALDPLRPTAEMKRRRMRGLYSDSYRKLLNSNITAAAAPFLQVHSNEFAQTHFSASFWTSKEKDIFFDALARYGRDDLPKISTAIGTKSPIEIREYVLTLQEGLIEHSLNDPRYGLASLADLPAAVEVGEVCEEKLNRAADALALRQWEWETRQEQQKRGQMWLINANVAKDLDDAVEDGLNDKDSSEEDEEEVQQGPSKRLKLDDSSYGHAVSENRELRQAATLLQTSNWIRLSTAIFMNAGGERWGENWQSIATQEEEPSMMRTAFTDFHCLAVTTTRRLVQTSVFQAMARLRASDVWHSPKRKRRLELTANDVKAALQIINVKEDAEDFWTWTARRCGVIVTGSTENDELSYEHVEAFLSESTVPQMSQHSDPGDSSLISDVEDDKEDEKLAALEREHEEYAEELDQRARAVEEADLLRALGGQISASPIIEKSVNRPPVLRKTKGDHVDWRDWTDYEAPWETQTAQE